MEFLAPSLASDPELRLWVERIDARSPLERALVAAAVSVVAEPANPLEAFKAYRRGGFPSEVLAIHSWFQEMGDENLRALVSSAETALENLLIVLDGVFQAAWEQGRGLDEADLHDCAVVGVAVARLDVLGCVLSECTNQDLSGIRGFVELIEDVAGRKLRNVPQVVWMGEDLVHMRLARGSHGHWWARLALPPFTEEEE